MYQILCDNYILYDPREETLDIINPRCKLKANTVGEGSFTILPNHVYYDTLKKLKSIFEIKENNEVIFRGRMINGSVGFDKQLTVDLEGILGVTNDTIIPPFTFPDDFSDAASADNVVEYFLQWILEKHNENVADWQKLKLGRVTVSDPNNYITRSSENYASTWDTLKDKLFESSLGGYLCIRYESDGNYVDYLKSFTETNSQKITLDENLLDITTQTDASETYSAILPIGADGLTIADLPDGNLSDDIVKEGVYIYSKLARYEYGWVCMPIDASTWDDVTIATNLQTKAKDTLQQKGVKLSSTITAKAVDLHFADSDIQSFRIYQNVLVDSPPHGVENAIYPLTELDIDIKNPQSTVITIGDNTLTLIDKQTVDSLLAGKKVENITQSVIELGKKVDKTSDDLNEVLTHEAIFNLLTDGGKYQGIYKVTDENGNEYIYLNASYLKTGTLDASKVTVTNLDASNIKSGTLDASKATVTNINASNINSGTLSADRLDVTSLMAKDLTATGKFQVDNGTWALTQTTNGLQLGRTYTKYPASYAYLDMGYGVVYLTAKTSATLAAESKVFIEAPIISITGDVTIDGEIENSNIYRIGELPNISSGESFNDYTTPGCYRVISNTVANGIAYMPRKLAGKLVVEASTGNPGASTYKYIVQTYYPYNPEQAPVSKRYATTGSTTATWEFGPWVDLLDSETLVVDSGSATIPFYNGAASEVYVRFNKTFTSPPAVIVSQVFNECNIVVLEEDIDEMGFTARTGAVFTSSGDRTFRWVAVET